MTIHSQILGLFLNEKPGIKYGNNLLIIIEKAKFLWVKSPFCLGLTFSDGEKMLILMMADIYKHFKIKDADSDPEFLTKVIYGGHYWAPKWDMLGVFHDHVDEPEDVTHVVDVLDMWSFIEEAYDSFSDRQQQQIAKEVGPRGKNVSFHGFDGNNESSQLSIARFLINDMDRFSRFKGRDLNSHSQTYERYSRMVKMFETMRHALIGHGLNIEQVIKLLKA